MQDPIGTDSGSRESLPFRPAVGCGFALAAGLIALLILFQVTRLVLEGEVRLGGHPLQPSRVWLVREDDRQGVGLELSNTVDGGLDQESICRSSRVWFLLWRAEPDTARRIEFCDCYIVADAGWEYRGVCGGAP